MVMVAFLHTKFLDIFKSHITSNFTYINYYQVQSNFHIVAFIFNMTDYNESSKFFKFLLLYKCLAFNGINVGPGYC